MRDPNNFFTEKDFLTELGEVLGNIPRSQNVAEKANSLIRKALGHKVFGYADMWQESKLPQVDDSHEAHLFCVKDIKK